MNPSDDALYRIHQFQAARRGCPPLDYCSFRMRMVNQNDTDLSQVFLPESPVGRKPVVKTAAICATSSALASIPWYEFMMALALAPPCAPLGGDPQRPARVLEEAVDLARRDSLAEAEKQRLIASIREAEADPGAGKVSYESAIGKALLGKKVGDDVTVQAPDGASIFKIVSIK